MKRKTWNREENRQLYKDYYRNQAPQCHICRAALPARRAGHKAHRKTDSGQYGKDGYGSRRRCNRRAEHQKDTERPQLAGIKRTVAEIVDQSPPDKQRPQKKKKRPPPPSLTKNRPPQQ